MAALPTAESGRMSRTERESRFERLLAEHGPAVRRLAAGYERDAARREDLVQETILAIWQALARFREECSDRTFVFRVAHNRGLTHVWRRRSARKQVSLDELEEMPDPQQDPRERAEKTQRRVQLQEAVRRLPLGARQVITLNLEGLSHREIGEVLGISENNVAVRVGRARRLLREALGEGRGR